MAIPDPWATAQETAETPEKDSNWARERERDHAGAREYQDESDVSTGGRVVQFPGATTEIAQRDEPGALVKLGDAARVWGREARETGTAALDGSVWRAKPPSLRDMHARANRAEWAGDIAALRIAGAAFGWVSLVITAVGYGLLWIARRPSRLVLTTAIAVLIVVLTV